MNRLSEDARRYKVEYNLKRNNEQTKLFCARFLNEYYEEICDYLKSIKMNKAEFIRWAYEELKKQKNIDKISK